MGRPGPFPPLLDVLLDVSPPLDAQPVAFRRRAIIVENVDVALEVADRDQLGLAVSVHVGHAEPAVGPALVVAQLRLLPAGRALEDHHAIVGRHADLRDAVAVEVVNDVEGTEHRRFRRVSLPDEAG